MNKKKLLLSFAVIFFVAFSLRLWRLNELPPSLSIDEVTFGYSGYSILKTGKDEYGRFLPLAFEGIGDFKPPVDVYLNVVSIYLLGFNEFSVRIPGVILGSLSTILLVLLLRELKISWPASLFGGFWLAISGWHIFFSRAGFEAITALFFLTAGLYAFLVWVRRQTSPILYLSIISFGLSAWSYHAERVFVPVLFVFLIIYFRNKLTNFFTEPRRLFLPIIILAFFALPFLFTLMSSEGIRARASELWLTRDPSLYDQLHKGQYSSLSEFIFDNDLYLITRTWVGQYLNYFDLRFWFWKGVGLTPPNFQDIGLIYIIDLPLFIIGIYSLIKSKNKLSRDVAAFFLLAGPLPGAFARGDPSPIRVLVWVPFFAIVLGSGFTWLISKGRRLWLILYFILLIGNVAYFYDLYIYGFHNFYADIWHYGYKEAVQYACQNKDKYEEIIITDKYGIELPNTQTVPHYYILFHCRYDPEEFLKTRKLYNITGRQPHWRIDNKLNNTLLIGSPWDFPEGFPEENIMKKIYFLNGKPAFFLVETDSET